jgi:glyoxylase-like metal-dependent hydrolase (beta-lactamase superfamily II)
MDTPLTRGAWEPLLERLDAGRRLRRIIVTHHHPDHLGLACALAERFGCEVWMSAPARAAGAYAWHGASAAQRAQIEAWYRSHGMTDVAGAVEFSAAERRPKLISGMPEISRLLADGDELPLGRRRWRVTLVGGHAAGQATLHDAVEGVLITGDQVLPRISSNVSVLPLQGEADPLGEFRASLQRLRALGEPLVLPSHGAVFRGLGARIDALFAHHDGTLKKVQEYCATPRTAAQVRDLLYPRRLDSFHATLAFGETLAHLNHLWTRGVLARQMESGTFFFAQHSPS